MKSYSGQPFVTTSIEDRHRHRTRLLAVCAAIPMVVWTIAVPTNSVVHFVLFTTKAKTGFDVFLAVANLFVALVLFLFPSEHVGTRLRWVAFGLLLLSFGALVFGYLAPAVFGNFPANTQLYQSILTRLAGLSAIVVGLVPSNPPSLPWRRLLLLLVLAGVGIGLASGSGHLPVIVEGVNLEYVASKHKDYLPGLTAWYWPLALLSVGLASASVIGALRWLARERLGAWFTLALTFMAGVQLHTMFWPSTYTSIFTTASVLRLGFTTIIAVGAVLELRDVAAERGRRLAREREYSARLVDLAVLKADFTAMIGHELASPLSAIQRAAEYLDTSALDRHHARAVEVIQGECASLSALVDDIRESARAERNDFTVRVRPTPVAGILADAAAFAHSLPGTHPCTIQDREDAVVMADPYRIGQVLRNLLTNAVRYTPPNTPISLRAFPVGPDLMRFEVIDHGPGIMPDEAPYLFDKFRRGRAGVGSGLGLYLSQRIVRAHSAELHLASTPGQGTVVWFDLPRV